MHAETGFHQDLAAHLVTRKLRLANDSSWAVTGRPPSTPSAGSLDVEPTPYLDVSNAT